MTRNNLHLPIPSPDWTARRKRMVDEQLRCRGIRDERVLAAMMKVPRHEFVSQKLSDVAYADSALPIEFDQTISQPYTVAFMCQAAHLTLRDNVLEVGTGSGYGAAVLSELAGHVHTMERIPQLAEAASRNLKRLGYANVVVQRANGTLGLPEEAPFDAIIVTAGAEALPDRYVDQLADGGRIVIPIGQHSVGQTMFRFTLKNSQLNVEDLGGFAFVPLIGDDEDNV